MRNNANKSKRMVRIICIILAALFFAFADNRSADVCFRLKGKLKWGM